MKKLTLTLLTFLASTFSYASGLDIKSNVITHTNDEGKIVGIYSPNNKTLAKIQSRLKPGVDLKALNPTDGIGNELEEIRLQPKRWAYAEVEMNRTKWTAGDDGSYEAVTETICNKTTGFTIYALPDRPIEDHQFLSFDLEKASCGTVVDDGMGVATVSLYGLEGKHKIFESSPELVDVKLFGSWAYVDQNEYEPDDGIYIMNRFQGAVAGTLDLQAKSVLTSLSGDGATLSCSDSQPPTEDEVDPIVSNPNSDVPSDCTFKDGFGFTIIHRDPN
tara:strand:+ start:57419 stop:58243 length:825 start_codon:yes stop_codon:yes gene_type:complete